MPLPGCGLVGNRSAFIGKVSYTTCDSPRMRSCLRCGSGAKLGPDNHRGDGMLLVTGGAGFIGSNVVAALNDAGRDVAVCDVLGQDGKWRNLAKRRLAAFVPPSELMDWLTGRRLEALVHHGAISETTAPDGE